jgi:hypothetical protein
MRRALALPTALLALACHGKAEDTGQTVVTTAGDTATATDSDPRDTHDTHDTESPPEGDLEALALPGHTPVSNGRFATADACTLCHAYAPSSSAMTDEDGRNVAPYDLWQGTMMANATRDPVWRTVMANEIAHTPAAAEAIAAKCTTCHAPMGHADALLTGEDPLRFDDLAADSERGALARDGVSCTLCHQIEPDSLGESSGAYQIAGAQKIYGPHADPFEHPMVMHSGYTPTASDHINDAALCATCHTLTTHALAADGSETGGSVVEQGPYLEWAASSWRDLASCQDCHLPTTSVDGEPIATDLAHNPAGMDWPPIGNRSPYGRHLLVGGNTLVPAMLRDFREILAPPAPDEAFDAVIAAARDQLEHRTAAVALQDVALDGDTVRFAATVTVQTGHRLPTGIPLRRVWLRAVVTDATGATVADVGGWNASGELVDSDGTALASEAAGGPIAPHRTTVEQADEVPVYEAILADDAGAPTFLLMRGAGYAKDNRLLPLGWDADLAGASGVGAVGVTGDADFAGGGDVVRYALEVAGATPPLTVEVSVHYQPLSARWAAELFAGGTPEAGALALMWAAADRSPETLATATASPP